MVTRDVDRPEPSASASGGELVVEWQGSHAFVKCSGEVTDEGALLPSVPAVPGNLLVTASRTAHGHPDLLAFIRTMLVEIWARGVEPRPWAVWLAVPDLGNPDGEHVAWLHGLAAEAGIEVHAPQGEARLLSGAGMYVDRSTGGTGWRRFGPDSFGDVVGCRFPVPSWEHLLPQASLRTAGLVTRLVPAGLAVSSAASAPRNDHLLALRVPLNLRIPKLVLGGPGSDFTPASVAALLELLPDALLSQLVLVPGSVGMTRPEWLLELVDLVGHDVALCPGTQMVSSRRGVRTVVLSERGEEMVAPFATLFLQRPGADLPVVIDVSPPPLGWSRIGSRGYQPTRDRRHDEQSFAGVEVEVVPGGISVHLSGKPANRVHFDPAGWTLGIGTPGAQVSDEELAAVRNLLDGLATGQRSSGRVRVFGVMSPEKKVALEAYVRAVGAVPFQPGVTTPVSLLQPSVAEAVPAVPQPTPPVAPTIAESAEPAVSWPSTAGSIAASPAAAEPPVVAQISTGPPVAEPPVATSGAVPVATVSSPEPPQVWRESTHAVDLTHAADPMQVAESQHTPAPIANDHVVPPRPLTTEPITLADRPSTPAEQARLSESAGARYTEALATVNVALSAWPMLRPESKADYIAVCLYLGAGEVGGVSLNEALRTGESAPLDGYAQCLMSGLRRLPTHRQVVLRQENLLDGGEPPHPVGAVLVEPAFLSASTGLDVTTDSADVDVLIWPVSARRTSELAVGRAVQEAVFPPGRRFKVLSVKTWEEEDETEGTRAPQTALLTRELLAGENAHSEESAARDVDALERLERAWAARQAAGVWSVNDPDMKARLSLPLLVAAEEPAATSDERLGMVS
ncbi:hypothetical protein JNUCC0626_48175 [Lentzea sp. JNUCC 0626]|uniref:hypothetical protein n=1 Tax=Lentzea sp. JNUCC 0626 TaxID=3367513 RepID=UPI0037499991